MITITYLIISLSLLLFLFSVCFFFVFIIRLCFIIISVIFNHFHFHFPSLKLSPHPSLIIIIIIFTTFDIFRNTFVWFWSLSFLCLLPVICLFMQIHRFQLIPPFPPASHQTLVLTCAMFYVPSESIFPSNL